MEALRIITDLEEIGFREGEYKAVEYEGRVTIGAMAKGTESGKPVVMIGLDMGDHVLVVQTTLALFLMTADTFRARYEDSL